MRIKIVAYFSGAFLAATMLLPAPLFGSQEKKKNIPLFKKRPEAPENKELFWALMQISVTPFTLPCDLQNHSSPPWFTTLINYSAKHDLTKLFKILYPLYCKISAKALPFFAKEKKSALHYAIEHQNKEVLQIIINSWTRRIEGQEASSDLLKEDNDGNNFLHWLAKTSKNRPDLFLMIDYTMKELFITERFSLIKHCLGKKNYHKKYPADFASPQALHLFKWDSTFTRKKEPLTGLQILEKMKRMSFESFVNFIKQQPPEALKSAEMKIPPEFFENQPFDLCKVLENQDDENLTVNKFKKLHTQVPLDQLGFFIRLCATNRTLLQKTTHDKIKKNYFCDVTFRFTSQK